VAASSATAGAGDPAADDDHVELLLAERAKRLAALDHARSLAEPERRPERSELG